MGNIPKLRFPEFKGEWEKKKMGDIYSFKITNSFSRENLNYENGSVKNIHYGDIHTRFQTLFNITKETVPYINPSVSIVKIDEDNYCREGDLILADASEDMADVGKSIELIFLNSERLLSGLHTILARPSLEKFSIGFGGYLFKSNFVRTQIKKESQGSKVLSISTTRLSRILLVFPNKKEQVRIATFFSAIDQRLNQLKQKKALLEQYKKGVMQKLFSQELRFKDEKGKAFPEWEKKKLGEVADNIQSGKNKTDENGEYDLHGSMGIIGKCYNYSYDGKFILIARVGANAGSINIVEGKFGVSDNTLVVSNNKIWDVYFMYFLLISENLNKLVFGSGQPLITGGQLKSLDILLPLYAEQTKIANFLSAIDEKINRIENQIQHTQQYKKGLLQKMFC